MNKRERMLQEQRIFDGISTPGNDSEGSPPASPLLDDFALVSSAMATLRAEADAAWKPARIPEAIPFTGLRSRFFRMAALAASAAAIVVSGGFLTRAIGGMVESTLCFFYLFI